MEEYKQYNSIESKKQDNNINSVIEAISEAVKAYLGFDVTANQSTEVIKTIAGRYDYFLDSMDADVTKVTYRARNSTPVDLGEYDYIVSDIGKLSLLIPFSIRDNELVIVTYSKATPKTLADIKLATMLWVRHYLQKEYNKESTTAVGTTISFTSNKDVPSHVKALLNLHKVL